MTIFLINKFIFSFRCDVINIVVLTVTVSLCLSCLYRRLKRFSFKETLDPFPTYSRS